MPTNKPQIKTYVTDEQYFKLKEIARSENRTVSNLLNTLLMEKIKEYEVQFNEKAKK